MEMYSIRVFLCCFAMLCSAFGEQSHQTVDNRHKQYKDANKIMTGKQNKYIIASRVNSEKMLCIPHLAKKLVNPISWSNNQTRKARFRSKFGKGMLPLVKASSVKCSRPDDFIVLSSEITVLDLSNLGLITSSFGSWRYFHNLTHIYLKRNAIENLHLSDFKELSSLIALDISHNRIKQINPIAVLRYANTHLKRLTHIDLRENSIKVICGNNRPRRHYAFNDPHMLSFDFIDTTIHEDCSTFLGSYVTIIINTNDETHCNCGNVTSCICTQNNSSTDSDSIHLSVKYHSVLRSGYSVKSAHSAQLSVNSDSDQLSDDTISDNLPMHSDADQLLVDMDFQHISVHFEPSVITLKISSKTVQLSCICLITGTILFIYCMIKRRKRKCKVFCMKYISCFSTGNDLEDERKGVFLVSSEKDNDVLLTFADELEKRNIETVFDGRDFAHHGGKSKMFLIHKSLHQSCRTIFLISSSFFCDAECIYTLKQAKAMEMTQNRFVIIIIKLKGHLNEQVCRLHEMFVNNICLDFPPTPDKANAFWDQLIRYINDSDTHVHFENIE